MLQFDLDTCIYFLLVMCLRFIGLLYSNAWCVMISRKLSSFIPFFRISFIKILLFEWFQFFNKIKREIHRFPVYPLPTYICTASPITNIFYQSSTFVKTGKPTLTRHNYLKSIVYIMVLSLCDECDDLDKYNDIYLSLWHHTEYFHCPKNPLCSVCSSLPAYLW